MGNAPTYGLLLPVYKTGALLVGHLGVLGFFHLSLVALVSKNRRLRFPTARLYGFDKVQILKLTTTFVVKSSTVYTLLHLCRFVKPFFKLSVDRLFDPLSLNRPQTLPPHRQSVNTFQNKKPSLFSGDG